MEWNDIRVFLAIARHGSLGAAGRALHVAQPTVGRRLDLLERALGHRLFQRTHTGLVLTDEGHSVRETAERMESEALAFERRLAGNDARFRGLLRVTASDWFGRHVLAPALVDFAEAYPGIDIELLTDPRLYDLDRREADIAFRIVPFESPDIVSRRFVDIDYGLFAAHADAAQGDVRLVTMDARFAELPDAVWLQARFPDARAAFRSNDRDVQAQACAAGAGLAVLPLPLAVRYPSLVRIETSEAPPSRRTWVGYHRDMRRLPRLRALMTFLQARR